MDVLKYKDIEIEVRRSSRRRTVDLTVDRGGNVVMAVPAALSEAEMRDILLKKELWLCQTLDGKRQVLHPKRAREYVSGEGFYYLGKTYRLKVDNTPADPCLSLKNGRFWLSKESVPEARSLFVAWYIDRAHRWLMERLPVLQERAGAQPAGMYVRDLGYRWGSCGKDNMLYFNWRTILLPPERIRYLVIHELIHLREHNHSKAFYDILSRAEPNHLAHEKWLKENGDLYDL